MIRYNLYRVLRAGMYPNRVLVFAKTKKEGVDITVKRYGACILTEVEKINVRRGLTIEERGVR